MNPNVFEMIQQRRSHFLSDYSGEPISKVVIETLIEMAHCAPSHKLTRPWFFTVYSQFKLPQLATKILEAYTRLNPQADTDGINAKLELLKEKAAYVICVSLKRNPAVPLWEEIACIGAAVQNMYMVLTNEEDIGGYWSTGYSTNSLELRELLELKEDDLHLGYFIVGKLNKKRIGNQRPNWEQHVKFV